jgi:hypothetical protein
VAQAIRCARLARFSTAFHVLPVAAWVRRPWLADAAIHSDLAFSPLGRRGAAFAAFPSFAPFPSHGQVNGLFDHHLNLQNLPIPLLPFPIAGWPRPRAPYCPSVLVTVRRSLHSGWGPRPLAYRASTCRVRNPLHPLPFSPHPSPVSAGRLQHLPCWARTSSDACLRYCLHSCPSAHLHICTSARPRFSTPSLNLTRCSKDTTLPSPHQGQTVPNGAQNQTTGRLEYGLHPAPLRERPPPTRKQTSLTQHSPRFTSREAPHL